MLLGSLAVPASASATPPIVFSSDRGPDFAGVHRYSITLSGADRRDITAPRGVRSPNGRLTAWAGGTTGAPTIEVSAPDGGPARTIVAGFPEEPGIVPGQPSIFWAPSSRLLALLVPRTCVARDCFGNDIWTVRVDGSALVHVGSGRRPAWSADSRRLAFVRYYSPFSHDAVFVVGSGGSGTRAVAAGTLPVWSPRGHLIAYAAVRAVGVVDPDRRASRRIVARGYVEGFPAWSADARSVAVVLAPPQLGSRRLRALVVCDLRSGRSRVLARAASPDATLELPAFSPHGNRLAYVASTSTYAEGAPSRTYANEPQVFVAAVSRRGASRQVTHELPWATFSALTWTPGGRLVYDVSQWHNDRELWAVQPDGTGLAQLTDNLFDDISPAWSPDGTQIVFERSNAFTPFPTVAEPGIYVLDPATGAERRLVETAPDDAAAAPAWAPDGAQIAFVLRNTIALVRPDGTLIRNMSALGRPQHPTWSADSSRLAFSDNAPAHLSEIYMMGRDGTSLTQLTNFDYAAMPAWSPDGRWLAFWGDRNEGDPSGIWIMRPDGSAARFVVRTAGSGALAPAWSPDSSRLLYETQNFATGSTELHAIALDGNGDTVLTSSRSMNDAPSWRP